MRAAADRPELRHLALATLVLGICAALSVPALGAAPNPERQPLLDSTVRFLQDSQQPSGGFARAGEPGQGTSAWVALALAAAGINPRNQAKPCGADAYTYLLTHFREAAGEEIAASEGQIATTALERELLVVNASGTDPHDFAGFDLTQEILDGQLPGGAFPYVPGGEGQVNTTVFAILALSPVAEPAPQAAIRVASEWLLAQQNDDGGWHWQSQATASEVDMTGAAIEALNAAGAPSGPAERTTYESAQRRGFGYLEGAQLADGGFPALPAGQGESNVASTAWAVQGIWSAGGNPETWRTGSGLATEEPLDYMESMQQPDGHIRWSQSDDLNGIWMTAYVAPGVRRPGPPDPRGDLLERRRAVLRDQRRRRGDRCDRRRWRRRRTALQPAEATEQGQDPRRRADRPQQGPPRAQPQQEQAGSQRQAADRHRDRRTEWERHGAGRRSDRRFLRDRPRGERAGRT